MKLHNCIFGLILRSHIIVALAATLLAYQSLIVIGDNNFKFQILLVVFFGTLFIYNLADINISIASDKSNKISLSNRNSRLHIWLCTLSLAGFLIEFIPTCRQEKIVVLITGFFALVYVMPFTKNNTRLKGFRNIPVIKNIILAAVWAIATAWLPLMSKSSLHSLDLTFIFLKRFFFVLPLCMVFDVRDQYSDLKNNVKTIPNQLGIHTTKNLAWLAMLFFVIVVFLHKKSMEAIGSPLLDFSIPLYVSAVIASVFIYMINETKKNAYYILVIDGSMILQFLLVYIFVLIK